MTITKGDRHTFNVTVKDSAGVIFDLTGFDMVFTAKSNLEDTDANAEIQKAGIIADPVTGIGSFILLPSDTNIDVKSYRYDVQISDGNTNVHTVIKNQELIITDEVTQDI